MMDKEQFPQGLRADLAVAFSEGRKAYNSQEWRELIDVVPTTSSSKLEVFYGDKTELRRWRGERQPSTFYEYKQVITLDDWEMTETVKRQVLDDDQTGGLLRRTIGNFGLAVETSLKKKTEEHLRRGVSYRCFDTNMFFGLNHVYTDTSGSTRGIVQANWERGGSQLDTSTISADESHFAKLQTDRGHVMGLRLTHVGVKRGSNNHVVARQIANSQFTIEIATVKGANTQNIYQGAFGIIPMDYGLGDSEWYSFDLSDPAYKPVKVLSHSISPGFNNLEYSQLLTDSDTGFWRNEFAFGIFGRFDWNPGDWRVAYLHGTSAAWTDPETDLERQRIAHPNM
jgi:phage major head subunit gpT-like protein